MIKCDACGAWGPEDAVKCPRCQKPFTDYQAAHIPCRPETDVVGGENAPLPGDRADPRKTTQQEPRKMNVCPECGNKMIPSEGCALCPACGFGYCG